MPRVKLAGETYRKKDFSTWLEGKCYETAGRGGLKGCEDATGIKKDKMRRRLEEPYDITVGELRQLAKGLRVTKEELLAQVASLL